MSDVPSRPPPRNPSRVSGYTSVGSESVSTATAPSPATAVVDTSIEQRVAITLNVVDGFRFGCGFLLACAAFYFGLLILVAVALLVAVILGVPLPFGGTTR